MTAMMMKVAIGAIALRDRVVHIDLVLIFGNLFTFSCLFPGPLVSRIDRSRVDMEASP